jgi:hemerythrin-like domain-containing protein
MSVTNTLKSEHQFILQYIDLMEKYARYDAAASSDASTSLLLAKSADFIEFIHDFADTFHHAKEEDVLFKYLASPGILNECNPLPVMLREHAQARELLKQMQYAASLNNVADLISCAQGYASILKQHIFKEDNILYAMAERNIDEQEKLKLLTEYKNIEEIQDGHGKTVKFQNQLSKLQSYFENHAS